MAERTAEPNVTQTASADSPIAGLSAAFARRATIILYATFLILGLAGMLLGPAFQGLTARFNIPLEDGGIFTTLQFLGVAVGVVIAGRVLDRVNARFLLSGGALLMGVGLLVISAAGSLPVALLGALLLGFGYAMLDVSPNVVIAALNPTRASAALNLLNLFFGVGAIIGPQVVNYALGQGDIMIAFRLVAVAALTLAVPLFTVSLFVGGENKNQPRARVNWLPLVPFGIFLFLMVGSEVGFGSWIVTEMTLVTGTTAAMATLGASIFWVGVTASRALAPLFLRKLSDEGLLLFSVLLLGGAVIALLLVPHVEIVALLVAFAAGYGTGPLFPTAIAIVNDRYPAARGTASGALIAVGTAGASVLPWLQGQIGGGVNGGMIMIPVAVAAAAAMISFMRRRDTGATSAHPAA